MYLKLNIWVTGDFLKINRVCGGSYEKKPDFKTGLSYTVFPLTSAPSAHLFSRLFGAALIGKWHLQEGGAYLKTRETTHVKFEICNFLF